MLLLLIFARYFQTRFLKALVSYDLLVLLQLMDESIVGHDESSLFDVLESLIRGPSLLPNKVGDHDRG